MFVLCGKTFQVCKAWKGTLKNLPEHSFNGVIISSARVCTVFAFPFLLVPFYNVVLILFTLRGASCLVLPCSLSTCFFCPFSILSTLLGEEGAGLCAYRAFVC